MAHPFARLLRSFALQLFAWTRPLQLPPLQSLKRRNLRQVQHIKHIGAPRSYGDPCVVADAEIAHRVRQQRHPHRQRKQDTRQFHYNSPYESKHGCGWMRLVITYQDIPPTGELQVPTGTVITPSARDAAAERGVKIVVLPADQIHSLAPPDKTVAIGADHGGFRMKEQLKPVLAELGLAIRDVGVTEEKPADYPDIAQQVAELVAGGA